MTTFAEDAHIRTIEVFKPFRSLWKVDDPNWVDQRKLAWKQAHPEGGGDPHTQFRGRFYVYGEEPPLYIDDSGDVNVAFDFLDRIAYTPFETAEQVRHFWDTVVETTKAGLDHLHGKFESIGEHLDLFPERDRMVKLVTESLFTERYFMQYTEGEPYPSGLRRVYLHTIHPQDFVTGYCSVSPFYNKKNKHQWDYHNFSFDYFMLCVEYCQQFNRSHEPRQPEDLSPHEDLVKMYHYLLKFEDSGLSEYRLDLKQKLVSAATGDDAPELLRNALRAAREKLAS